MNNYNLYEYIIDFHKDPNNPTITFQGLKCLAFLDKIYTNASYYLTRKKAYFTI